MKQSQFYLDQLIDTKALFKLAERFAHEEGTFLLYSGNSYETAQRSYLFLFPYESIKIDKKIQIRSRFNQLPVKIAEANPWEAMQILGKDIGQKDNGSAFPEWVEFFSYEMGAFSDKDIMIPHLLTSIPEAYWQKSAVTLMVDQQTGKAWAQVINDEEMIVDHPYKEWIQRLSTQEGWQNLLMANGLRRIDNSNLISASISDTEESYIKKIELAKEWIKSGDVYQINLSQQWEFLGDRDPFDLFKRLAILNPAPFAAYIHLKEFSIMSSSPERFLQKKGDHLETRPIKGTAPRGKTEAEDLVNQQNLLKSEKELAELMMITDLMRNDLGKISVNGSVDVPLLCGCEAYQNVFHLFSIVRSRVLAKLHPLNMIRACFPEGSITGCPKLRAMEVIAELEQRARGIYTGAIGYFSENGDFDFNIAIRTLMMSQGKINVQLGGGIVIDSDPRKEYEETYHKGRSIFEILHSSESFI